MKKVITILILGFIILSFGSTDSYASSTQLSLDGTQSSWAVNELREAYSFNLTYPTIMNNYKRDITREEFSTIAVKLYEA